MKACIDPPELNNLQLSMFIDNEADDDIIDHLRRCPYCQARAKQFRHTQKSLKTFLYRQSCPAPEELRDFSWNLLSSEQATVVAHHLTRCPYCNHELLNNYVEERSPQESFWVPAADLLHRVQVFIASLLQTPSSNAFAYRAGQDDAMTIDRQQYQVGDDIVLRITIKDDDEHPGHKVLEGLVSGLDTEGIYLDLWQANELVQTLILDSGGDFQMMDLAPQSYELILSGFDFKIHIPTVSVGVKSNNPNTTTSDSSASNHS